MWIILLVWIGLSSIVGLILDNPNQELAKVKTKSAEIALIVIAPVFLFYIFVGLIIAPLVHIALSSLEWIINFTVGWFE